MGCSHAIYTVRRVVERFIKGGNTVNLCAIDFIKAFDNVNHHALLMKLMKINLPVVLTDILENWLNNKLSYRREAVRCLVLLSIFVSR